MKSSSEYQPQIKFCSEQTNPIDKSTNGNKVSNNATEDNYCEEPIRTEDRLYVTMLNDDLEQRQYITILEKDKAMDSGYKEDCVHQRNSNFIGYRKFAVTKLQQIPCVPPRTEHQPNLIGSNPIGGSVLPKIELETQEERSRRDIYFSQKKKYILVGVGLLILLTVITVPVAMWLHKDKVVIKTSSEKMNMNMANISVKNRNTGNVQLKKTLYDPGNKTRFYRKCKDLSILTKTNFSAIYQFQIDSYPFYYHDNKFHSIKYTNAFRVGGFIQAYTLDGKNQRTVITKNLNKIKYPGSLRSFHVITSTHFLVATTTGLYSVYADGRSREKLIYGSCDQLHCNSNVCIVLKRAFMDVIIVLNATAPFDEQNQFTILKAYSVTLIITGLEIYVTKHHGLQFERYSFEGSHLGSPMPQFRLKCPYITMVDDNGQMLVAEFNRLLVSKEWKIVQGISGENYKDALWIGDKLYVITEIKENKGPKTFKYIVTAYRSKALSQT